MERREAVRYISILLGGTLVGSAGFLSGCRNDDSLPVFTNKDISFLDEVAETILPATGTPGAKAAKVGEFMAMMVNECYDEKEQQVFRDGMDHINSISKKQFDKSFIEASPRQRHEMLIVLDKEQKNYMQNKKPEQPVHFFRMVKELTLLGYFTSEIGCTQAKRWVPVPGRFDGCVPYKKGDKVFA